MYVRVYIYIYDIILNIERMGYIEIYTLDNGAEITHLQALIHL